MRTLGVLILVSACADAAQLAGERGGELRPFDPDAVIYADGCVPVPEAEACIEAHPVEFLHADAHNVSERCEALGYTCCDPQDWISQAAAECIAESHEGMDSAGNVRVTMSAYDDVHGPMFDVYGRTTDGLLGVGVHAATGRLTWHDNGDGVFS